MPLVPTALEQMVESWERSLRARNLAAKTVTVYGESARQFIAYLVGESVEDPAEVTKAHAEDFITGLLERPSVGRQRDESESSEETTPA